MPIAYRLNYVANRFTLALYDEIDRVSGLDRARFIAMLCLRETETATAQEISEATHRPKNSVSRAIRSLEKEGFIVRDTDPNDARRQPMRLTDEGNAVFDDLLKIAKRHENAMLATLDEAEVTQLDTLLLKLAR